jgi:hypothetical protein
VEIVALEIAALENSVVVSVKVQAAESAAANEMVKGTYWVEGGRYRSSSSPHISAARPCITSLPPSSYASQAVARGLSTTQVARARAARAQAWGMEISLVVALNSARGMYRAGGCLCSS